MALEARGVSAQRRGQGHWEAVGSSRTPWAVRWRRVIVGFFRKVTAELRGENWGREAKVKRRVGVSFFPEDE